MESLLEQLGCSHGIQPMIFDYDDVGNIAYMLPNMSVFNGSDINLSSSLESCNISFLDHFQHLIGNDPFRKIMEGLNTYLTPFTIVVGLWGNVLSFIVFTRTHLKQQSSSVYLASLALADVVFLLSLIIVWLSWIKV